MPIPCSVTPFKGIILPAIYSGEQAAKSVVIVLHGLGVSKEVQIPELQRLMATGHFAIAVDAPHHGERKDGYLQLMDNQPTEYEKHLMMLKIVFQQAVEVEAMVDFYQKQGKKVAVVGISMGGFTTFALLRGKTRPDLCAPFLASPDFRCPNRPDKMPESIMEKAGPADYLDEAFPTPIFMINGGQDNIVSSSHAKNFHLKLQKRYSKEPQRLDFHEFPESEHFMRPNDWYAAWEKLQDRLETLKA